MTILKIIAILGIVFGAVSLVLNFRNRGRKNIGVFIALIITSAALLALSFVVAGRNLPQPTEIPLAQNNSDEPEFQGVLDLSDPSVPDDVPEGIVAAADDQPETAPSQGDAKSGDEGSVAPQDDANAVNPESDDLAVDPLAPIANAGETIESARVNTPLTFSAAKSKKKHASLKTFLWNFGDDTSETGKVVKHAYSEPGMYVATLTVTDKEEHYGVATRIIYVNRPEHKVRYVHQKENDVMDSVISLPELSGTTVKNFEGSELVLEASGQMLSSGNCDCSLIVSLTGPECEAIKDKVLHTGKSKVMLKSVCKGAPGEYAWKIERNSGESCECSWKSFKIDGYEY